MQGNKETSVTEVGQKRGEMGKNKVGIWTGDILQGFGFYFE